MPPASSQAAAPALHHPPPPQHPPPPTTHPTPTPHPHHHFSLEALSQGELKLGALPLAVDMLTRHTIPGNKGAAAFAAGLPEWLRWQSICL